MKLKSKETRKKIKSTKQKFGLFDHCISILLCWILLSMPHESISVTSCRSKDSVSRRRSRSLKPLDHKSLPPDQLIAQLIKFRVDGRTINARNVDELYPGLDRLLLRCLQTGDYRQLDNRLRRNLKPEYLLITGKHIQISVSSQTEDLLENLVQMGATLGKFLFNTNSNYCSYWL
jgi:hypothetical protein